MARLITLSFPASNTTFFATTVSGVGPVATILLSIPYPLVFPNLARTITLSSLNDNSGTVFTITGTDQFGNVISENGAGPNNSTVTTVNKFHTITNISASGNWTNLSIGSGSTGTFQWIKVNTFNIDPNITITGEVTGTINYTINQTIDNLEYYQTAGSTFTHVVNTMPVSFPVTAALTAATTNQIYTLTTPTTALQGIVNSSTGGSLNINILQQGII